jgi:hypothetical protein
MPHPYGGKFCHVTIFRFSTQNAKVVNRLSVVNFLTRHFTSVLCCVRGFFPQLKKQKFGVLQKFTTMKKRTYDYQGCQTNNDHDHDHDRDRGAIKTITKRSKLIVLIVTISTIKTTIKTINTITFHPSNSFTQ